MRTTDAVFFLLQASQCMKVITVQFKKKAAIVSWYASTIGSGYNLANLGYSPEISLGDTNIKRVYSGKSLGIHIDERLSWSSHIDHVAKKVSPAIGGLRPLRQFVNHNTLITIYPALF